MDANVPYSFSRWTDVPAGKWPWFKQQLAQGWMLAIDQRTSIPAKWSLAPEDTAGLLFWTKNPENLVIDAALLRPYKLKIHVTLTGWEEVEKRAPKLDEGLALLRRTVETFGPDTVVWRFSPIPAVEDVLRRFERIVTEASALGLTSVFVSFLQDNDRLPELRTAEDKLRILHALTDLGATQGVQVLLCNEYGPAADGLKCGVCAPPQDFGLTIAGDGCGCSYVVDPFSINETCVYGCTFCYASDKLLSLKRRNTSL